MSQNAMEGSLTLRDLTKLLGKLTSKIQAILPAKLQICFLQQIQIQSLRKNMTYESVITQHQQAKEELSWWIRKLKIDNGKSLLIVPLDLTIFPDASKKVCTSCQGVTTGGRWSSVETARYINVLELEAVRLEVLSFTKLKKLNSIQLRIDNITALSYLLNMVDTQNKNLIKILKEIWSYLIETKIHLTAEYIPILSNQTADWESRNFQESSKWELCFKQICSHLGKPLLDLFASRLATNCHDT